MQVVELIAQNPQGLTIQEMVNALNHSKTSVYRIVCSLEELGYLLKNEETNSFTITKKLFKVGLSSLGTTTILEHAYEPMRRLRDELRETVVLGTLMGTRIIILEQVIGSHHFSFILKPGVGVCIHASAPGKAMMAYLGEEERTEILSKIEFTPFTDKTIRNAEEYLKELEQVRGCGYGLDMGEELTGVRCIGAPVFNQAGKAVATIWITGPAERISDEAIKSYGQHVVSCAMKISEKMGFNRNNKSIDTINL